MEVVLSFYQGTGGHVIIIMSPLIYILIFFDKFGVHGLAAMAFPFFASHWCSLTIPSEVLLVASLLSLMLRAGTFFIFFFISSYLGSYGCPCPCCSFDLGANCRCNVLPEGEIVNYDLCGCPP